MSDDPYGYCPICGALGRSRVSDPNGSNTVCENGHTYPSCDALESRPSMSEPCVGDQSDVQIRIEALRAASRIVAGVMAGGERSMAGGEKGSSGDWTLNLAEDFAKYLEGE